MMKIMIVTIYNYVVTIVIIIIIIIKQYKMFSLVLDLVEIEFW